MSSIEEFLTHRRIAIAGVSRNSQKYGHKVYFDLKAKGFEVYAINPGATEILGDPCYPNLSSLPVKVDVLNLVVPPEAGLPLLEECVKLGIARIWFQPGAESEDLLRFCERNDLQAVHNQCVMVLSKAPPN